MQLEKRKKKCFTKCYWLLRINEFVLFYVGHSRRYHVSLRFNTISRENWMIYGKQEAIKHFMNV